MALDTAVTYWIVVSTSTTDSANSINLSYKNSSVYSNGKLMRYNSVNNWVDLGTSDLYFKTITTPYGASRGLFIGYKSNSDLVILRKAGVSIQWWSGTYWVDIITGLGLMKYTHSQALHLTSW